MSKIDSEGVEQLTIMRNALDSMYDKLESEGVFDIVNQEFQFIAELIDQIQNEWERV